MVDPGASDRSRQRSCNACVRSKRRCDKRTPLCTRCAKRGLPCLYHPAASSSVNFIPQARGINFEDLFITPDDPSIDPSAEFEYNHVSAPGPPLIQGPSISSDVGSNNSQFPLEPTLLEPTLVFDLPFSDLDVLTNYIPNTTTNSGMQTSHTLPMEQPTSMIAVSSISSSPCHASNSNNRFSVDESHNSSVS